MRVLGAWLCVAVGCGGAVVKPEPPPIDVPRPTQVGRYQVAVSFDPDPPKLGELFRATARVTLADGRPVETAKVELDARMPQHEHGMETRPRLRPGQCEAGDDGVERCRHQDGIYIFDGFKFHMAGDWTLLATIEGPKGPDSTSIVFRAR